jgi:glycogen debranching enzyme
MSVPDQTLPARGTAPCDSELEWLETNLLGSFCFACVDRKLRRKYHTLLTVRDPGRGDAWNLLAETRETLSVAGQSITLVDPLSDARDETLCAFSANPHATHRYRAGGVEIERSVRLGARDQVEIRYRLVDAHEPTRAQSHELPEALDASGARAEGRASVPLSLTIEPLLRCRPLHALTQENPFLDGTCVKLGDEVRMLPYAGMPAIALRVYGAQATFEEHGAWSHVGAYSWEAARGYPASESLFSPGRFTVTLEPAVELTFVVGLHRVEAPAGGRGQTAEQPPESTVPTLARAAAQFFAESTQHEHGIIAGYPWSSVHSREALLALPGVYLATGSWESAEQVLASLAKARVHGLIPHTPALFSSHAKPRASTFGSHAEPRASTAGAHGDSPSALASLLFAYTVQWFKRAVGEARVAGFMPIVCELLESLAEGNDPRVRFERGVSVYTEPGPYALTWMDASVDGQPVTARAGHAVELDALAYNAVHFACTWADDKRPGFARTFRNRLRNAEGEFVRRYWDDARGYLADGHDGDQPDVRLRPNQLWALALPHRPISNAMAHAALHAVTRDLWTPLGLRTLSPHDPDYRGSYAGDHAARERATHQGSVWPALTGLYADATLATLGEPALATHVAPILLRIAAHMADEGCIGQVSELFDGDAPHRAGGAPACAVSVAELYRTERLLAAVETHGAAHELVASDAAILPSATDSTIRPRHDSTHGTPKRTPHENQHQRETLSK